MAACGQRVAFGFCGYKLQEEPDSFLLTLRAFWIEMLAIYNREWGAFIQLIPQKGNNQNLLLIWSGYLLNLIHLFKIFCVYGCFACMYV